MNVLWLSVTSGLLKSHHSSSYNGGGWISGLQKVCSEHNDFKLALAYVSNIPSQKKEEDGVTYYPVYNKTQNKIGKLAHYYGGYKKWNKTKYAAEIKQIIEDFSPDIIHLFGMESPFNSIIGRTKIPLVVHLQGLLAPYDNAFYPIGFNDCSFKWPISLREQVLRNGYLFAKKSMHVRGEREKLLFKDVQYCMGRTKWDFQVSQLLSPKSSYFHVDEVLRSVFYQNAGQWKHHNEEKVKIISTLSDTVYKGLDVILKTAHLLKTETDIDYEWHIIGIDNNANIVGFFEKNLNISSGVVNVLYDGVKTADEVCNLLLSSDIYVHPSYIDNSPNSVCEAQILGIPVIGTDVGGISSLIDNGKTGLLVPANAPFELAYFIKHLAEDKTLSLKISEKEVECATKRHDYRKIYNELITVYNTILENH